MIRCTFLLLIFTINIVLNTAIASTSMWSDVSSTSANTSVNSITSSNTQARNAVKLPLLPDSYRLLLLDDKAMRKTLKGTESSSLPSNVHAKANKALQPIEIPLPNGESILLRVVKNSVMAPELSAKYPSIKTYQVNANDNKGVYGAVDITNQGFHAMLFMRDGSRLFIDPRSDQNLDSNSKSKTYYISYFSKDYHPDEKQRQKCQVESHNHFPIRDFFQSLIGSKKRTANRSGATLKTYKLAMAATGEYTSFHGGTKALALAAITTTVNRVNTIYERDLAIRFQLVANNDDLIHTNASTDPYSNNDGDAMLDQNQLSIDGIIGNTNYDIGHVVSTGGGGIAITPSACSSDKAGGVTGSSSPINDPFNIDFVAHEIGHQLGGNHTYNGQTAGCGGNRIQHMAYEPGSGTTIMAYAGLCGSDNVQTNSDAMFHSKSIDEMEVYIEGTGGSCGVDSTSSNFNAPTANAGNDYAIPVNTPFELEGSGSDLDGDVLTYSWEQIDAGSASTLDQVTSDNAIFRTFLPKSIPTRVFPQLSAILSGATSVGETLPNQARDLKFQLAVRDGKGGVKTDQTTLTVVGMNAFKVTSHATNEAFCPGETTDVTWDIANTNIAPVGCSHVNILLSTDQGATFINISGAVPNDGSHIVTLPATTTLTDSARIKVKCDNNIFFNISKAFLIGFGATTNSTSQAIPDNSINGITSQVTLSNLGVVAEPEISVDVNISHTYRGDLKIELISPSGATILLKQSNTDSANDVIGNFPINFTPVQPLSYFNGENLDGIWSLKVSDSSNQDIGTLNSWTIRYKKSTCSSSANTAPVATNSAFTTTRAKEGTLQASDINGDSLTYALVTNGSKGTAVINNTTTGTFTYTPNVGESGEDIFTFNVTDGTATSNTATVTITINLDTDNDGIPDSTDTDDDNDGLPDTVEVALGLNPLVTDSDGDNTADGDEDNDNDGFSNSAEVQAGSNPGDVNSVPQPLNPSATTIVPIIMLLLLDE